MSLSCVNAQQSFDAIASVSHTRLFMQKYEEKTLTLLLTIPI
jgi:hypothetical protein